MVGLDLIKQTKTFDLHIPIVAFGSHVATDILRLAHDHGADFVLPRSQFSANLPSLLERLDSSEV